MTDLHDFSDLARRYLLGELSADESDRFERRYLEDAALFARLEEAEAELLTDWAAGRLPPEQGRRLTERYQATPNGRFQLAFANALVDRAAAPGPVALPPAPAPRVRHPAVTWRRLALSAAPVAALVVFYAVTFVTRDVLRERRRAERPPAGVAAPSSASRSPASTSAEATPILRLAPGLRRNGGGTPQAALAAGASHLEIRLDAPASGTYRAALETAEGRTLWQRDGRAAAGDASPEVVLRVPARHLPPGDYVLSLSPAGEGTPAAAHAEYFFRIVPAAPGEAP